MVKRTSIILECIHRKSAYRGLTSSVHSLGETIAFILRLVLDAEKLEAVLRGGMIYGLHSMTFSGKLKEIHLAYQIEG